MKKIVLLLILSLMFPLAAKGQAQVNRSLANDARADDAKVGIHPSVFVPTAKTLAPGERQELYLQLIEDFMGWAESAYWHDSEEMEINGGYYNAKGRGVIWARGNSNLCLALAVLLQGRAGQSNFTKYQIPRTRLEQHLEKTLRALCFSNRNYSGHTVRRWGGPSRGKSHWQTSLEFTGAAWAAHLQENILQASTLEMVREVLADEAEYLKSAIPDYSPGDTKAEDCLWHAQFLAFAAQKLSSDPRAASWEEWAKRWALNSVSMPGDRQDHTTLVDGHPLSSWITTANVFPDYTLENHRFWHPAYNLEYGRMAQAEMIYKEFGSSVPKAFSFRAAEMWKRLVPLLLWDGDAAYPQGTDWAVKDIQHQYFVTWHATSRHRREASAYESRGVQFLRQRQMKRGNGSVCDFDFGYQTDLAYTWSICWQMHKYWRSDSTSYETAEGYSYGVYSYPSAKVAVHRHRQKIVSISWHLYSQAIHIMPQEGIDTFPDPPFYFKWDRDSGVLGHVKNSRLEDFESTHNGRGMRVTIRRPLNRNIDQYITLVSLPDEATVYSTLFHAKERTKYSVGRLFPLQACWLSESPGTVTQHRGSNWLNMSDYVSFITPQRLPETIPADRFFLTQTQTYEVEAGQWFGSAAVVIYVRQPHEQTERLAEKIGLIEDLPKKRLKLNLESSSGQHAIDLWPQS